MTQPNDAFRWNPTAVVEKYDQDAVRAVIERTGVLNPSADLLARYVQPYDVIRVEGNALTTAGKNRLSDLIIGANANTLDASRVRLGVGDNAAAFAVGDTALSTGSNQYFRVMDATFPSQAAGVISFKASFGDTEANFGWQCWGLDVGTPTVASSGSVNTPLVNRKVSSLGTKAAGTWALTVTVTIA